MLADMQKEVATLKQEIGAGILNAKDERAKKQAEAGDSIFVEGKKEKEKAKADDKEDASLDRPGRRSR